MPRHHRPPALRCVEVQHAFDTLKDETIALFSLARVFDVMRQPFGGHGPRAPLIAFDKPEQLLVDDVAAQIDAFVADKHMRAGNQRFHFMLGLASEGAIENR
jgi:hypothetical protein